METGEIKQMKHFITFEGIDGSGKSTISKLVLKELKSKGLDVVLTYEPTDSWIGRQVKNCIKSNADPFVTTFVFIADRIEHQKQIRKWLGEGKIVLCDRYVESTYAYQGAQLQNVIKNPIKWLMQLSENHYVIPDRTFVFIINPKKAFARIKTRDNLIAFEKLAFLEKVHKNYIKLAVGRRFKKVDASKSIDEIVDICIKDILR
jgi:dTMP kinase